MRSRLRAEKSRRLPSRDPARRAGGTSGRPCGARARRGAGAGPRRGPWRRPSHRSPGRDRGWGGMGGVRPPWRRCGTARGGRAGDEASGRPAWRFRPCSRTVTVGFRATETGQERWDEEGKRGRNGVAPPGSDHRDPRRRIGRRRGEAGRREGKPKGGEKRSAARTRRGRRKAQGEGQRRAAHPAYRAATAGRAGGSQRRPAQCRMRGPGPARCQEARASIRQDEDRIGKRGRQAPGRRSRTNGSRLHLNLHGKWDLHFQ